MKIGRITLLGCFLTCLLVSFTPEKQVTIFTIGDSTMSNKPIVKDSPERGWGQMFGDFFDSRYVVVDNHARNGRSSLSFRNQGLWDKVLSKIKPGDYVFIQFGHNDNKPESDRHTDPGTTYKEQLRKYVLESREKGATPVLFTSIVRRNFDSDGKLTNTHGEYIQAVRDLAKEMKVLLIDHNHLSEKAVQDLGSEGSKKIYMWIEKGSNKFMPKGLEDNTHLCIYGATVMAKLVLEEVRTKLPELNKFILPETILYKNPEVPLDKRVTDLIPRLTLAEKVSLLQDDAPAIPRLGIQEYNWWNEALHGVARNGVATVFPQAIGMAASFDSEAVNKVFETVSDEARAKHHKAKRNGDFKRYQGLTFWTPNINIFRDPRWGRGQETYGEDPFLTSVMGTSVVKGLQGDLNEKYLKAHACAKHFAVHSGPEWNRHKFDAKNISSRDLWETYLPAFKTLVTEAKVKEVMCAYNRYEGKPCCGSDELLRNILRYDWNYDGLVVSDCWAIYDFYKAGHHATHPDSVSASTDAVRTGTDIECGNSFRSLVKAVETGALKEEDLNLALSRILKARFELGLMDDDSLVKWSKIPESDIDCQEHRNQALEMARETMTLLSNKNRTLPLSKKLKKIAVIGPNANDSVMLLANYNGSPSRVTTILDGIKTKLPKSEIVYDKGCDWVQKDNKTFDFKDVLSRLKDIKTVVFVGGVTPVLEGEEMPVSYPGFKGGDRSDIELPAVQRALIKSLKEAGKEVVFVVCSGSALSIQPESKIADAILQAWYPGQDGGMAVADVLFGDYNPAGRLPVTIYTGMNQLPDFEDYSMKNRTYRYLKEAPLYPFGHGLSYSQFDYLEGKISSVDIPAGKESSLKIKIKNTGKFDGDEVIQVYIRNLQDPNGPEKSLRSFKRVNIKAGETKIITMLLRSDAFKFFDSASDKMKITPGNYEILYGGTSDNHYLKSIMVNIKQN